MAKFRELSNFCIERYKESLNSEYQKYIKTLYVSISDDNEVKCSTTPHILVNAYRCILIHVRSELAMTNWYTWYKVEYIDEEGCVTDGKLGNGFRLGSHFRGNYLDQRLNLLHDKDINDTTLIYSISAPFEEKMQKVWDVYRRARKAKSQAGLELMADLIEKDEKILDLEGEIANLKFTNILLEKQKKQYRGLLKQIEEMVNILKK